MSRLPGNGPFHAVANAADFGRVAVLMGGDSAERDISLLTGEAVLKALLQRGVQAVGLDVRGDLVTPLTGGHFDRVWIALHGRGGEDGTLQGLLTCLGLPYTGSGVLGSAISMDKLRTKRLLQGAGLATPRYCVVRNEADLVEAGEQLGLPLMLKPSDEGSSIGMSRIDRPEQMADALRLAAGCGCEVFAEEWVSGPEYTAAVLHGQVLPLVQIQTDSAFYDYQAKYFSDDTRYRCPAGLPAEEEQALARLALATFDAVGAAGWGRVDLMVEPQTGPVVLEVNTVPGMTSHSLVPMAAAAAGISFDELVWKILETSLPVDGQGASS